MDFPVSTVEGLDDQFLGLRCQTADIHVVAVWVGPRDVKRLDPASFAEQMLGDSGVEGVDGEVLLSL
jgi:hypothetical protein